MLNARALLGTHDVLFITLDSLRYDVAQSALWAGKTPFFASLLPTSGWELRHSPGSFTFAAHAAFFAGFLPTPATPGPHPRLWATAFEGSVSATQNTLIFPQADIVSGFAAHHYRTICIGGVGFFNQKNPLGCTLPNLFQESHWSENLGVSDAHSTENQVALATHIVRDLPAAQRLFLFVNVSAIHQPNCLFSPGATSDSTQTMSDALSYVDRHLPPLLATLRRRAPLLAVICADHGTTYGEDGFCGHRLAHPQVWNVPYYQGILPTL